MSAREAEAQQKDAMDSLARRRDEAVQPLAKPAPAPEPPRVQAAPAPAARPAPQAQPPAGVRGVQEPEARARVGAVVGAVTRSPEQWLQGIADLRRQGRHEEADKALAEFRRAYPDYKISEAILEKVEKR
jgi:hypothetical protein